MPSEACEINDEYTKDPEGIGISGDRSICGKLAPFILQLQDWITETEKAGEIHACLGIEAIRGTKSELIAGIRAKRIDCPLYFHTHPSGASFLSMSDIKTSAEEGIKTMCVGTKRAFEPFKITCYKFNESRLAPLRKAHDLSLEGKFGGKTNQLIRTEEQILTDPTLKAIYFEAPDEPCQCWSDIKPEIIKGQCQLKIRSEEE